MILKIHMRHLYVVKRINHFGNLARDNRRKERETFPLDTAYLHINNLNIVYVYCEIVALYNYQIDLDAIGSDGA